MCESLSKRTDKSVMQNRECFASIVQVTFSLVCLKQLISFFQDTDYFKSHYIIHAFEILIFLPCDA